MVNNLNLFQNLVSIANLRVYSSTINHFELSVILRSMLMVMRKDNAECNHS